MDIDLGSKHFFIELINLQKMSLRVREKTLQILKEFKNRALNSFDIISIKLACTFLEHYDTFSGAVSFSYFTL